MADEKLDTPVDEVVDEYVATWRFHIERLVTGADSRADGLQELWHVVARVDGVWDFEVLRDFLEGQPPEPARYRVVRYSTATRRWRSSTSSRSRGGTSTAWSTGRRMSA
jgi:hypothetical protein